MVSERVFSKYTNIKRYNYNPDEIGDKYDLKYSLRSRFGSYFELRKLESYLELLNQNKIELSSKKILDIGCHRGFHLRFFSELKQDSSELYGVDIIPPFIKSAKKVNSKLNFLIADASNLPFDDSFFDIILINYVFCESDSFESREEMAKHILSKLKKGGYIIFFDFYDSFWIRLIAKLKKWSKRINGLGSFNDNSINSLFANTQLLFSKSFINILTYRSVKISFFLPRLFDLFIPHEYYIVLLRKN